MHVESIYSRTLFLSHFLVSSPFFLSLSFFPRVTIPRRRAEGNGRAARRYLAAKMLAGETRRDPSPISHRVDPEHFQGVSFFRRARSENVTLYPDHRHTRDRFIFLDNTDERVVLVVRGRRLSVAAEPCEPAKRKAGAPFFRNKAENGAINGESTRSA